MFNGRQADECAIFFIARILIAINKKTHRAPSLIRCGDVADLLTQRTL
jgi:hypothetical protein